MCSVGCGGTGAGATPDEPLTLGAPGGPVYHVYVETGIAGLWPGEAWLTGSEAPTLIAAGLVRQITETPAA
jgi:hypothetical protein